MCTFLFTFLALLRQCVLLLYCWSPLQPSRDTLVANHSDREEGKINQLRYLKLIAKCLEPLEDKISMTVSEALRKDYLVFMYHIHCNFPQISNHLSNTGTQ